MISRTTVVGFGKILLGLLVAFALSFGFVLFLASKGSGAETCRQAPCVEVCRQAPPVVSSPCSSSCTCGCNEGDDCDCNQLAMGRRRPRANDRQLPYVEWERQQQRTPTRLIPQEAPVVVGQPVVSQLYYAPVVRYLPGTTGPSCGPGGCR